MFLNVFCKRQQITKDTVGGHFTKGYVSAPTGCVTSSLIHTYKHAHTLWKKKVTEVNSVQLTCVSASGKSTGRSLWFGSATYYGVSL